MPEDFEANIKERKLLTIYHFIRGLPLLYVVTCLRKELEDTKAKEKQMEEKLQEFRQRKRDKSDNSLGMSPQQQTQSLDLTSFES